MPAHAHTAPCAMCGVHWLPSALQSIILDSTVVPGRSLYHNSALIPVASSVRHSVACFTASAPVQSHGTPQRDVEAQLQAREAMRAAAEAAEAADAGGVSRLPVAAPAEVAGSASASAGRGDGGAHAGDARSLSFPPSTAAAPIAAALRPPVLAAPASAAAAGQGVAALGFSPEAIARDPSLLYGTGGTPFAPDAEEAAGGDEGPECG
jgi:hypothetical protein